MKFTKHHYRDAAIQRICEAERLFRTGDSYSLSMYCSGLAVECALRALAGREQQEFDGRHDLERLLRSSRILAINDEAKQRKGRTREQIEGAGRELREAMNQVAALWRNNLRYASEARLRSFLKQIDQLHGKGDAAQRNARALLTSARMVVDRAILLWTS